MALAPLFRTRSRTTIVDGQKQCTKCDRWLPAAYTHYRKDGSMRTGLRSHCRECDGHAFKFTPPATSPEKPPERFCRLCGKKAKLAACNPEDVCHWHEEWGAGREKGAHVVRK